MCVLESLQDLLSALRGVTGDFTTVLHAHTISRALFARLVILAPTLNATVPVLSAGERYLDRPNAIKFATTGIQSSGWVSTGVLL